MPPATIIPNAQGHLTRVIEDLLVSGWAIESIPQDGQIPRNRLELVLRTAGRDVRLRLFAYKVTSSSRGRPHERRVEITTTYQSGLATLPRFSDAVLGVDVETNRYVGIDPRRLRMGGVTHNASSFFDREGLGVRPRDLLINPRSVSSTFFTQGVELHAFFDRTRLADYLVDHRAIHGGTYSVSRGLATTGNRRQRLAAMKKEHEGAGDAFVLRFATVPQPRTPIIARAVIEAAETRDFSRLPPGRRISPEELRRILAVCEELGALGERAVLAAERNRLTRRGLGALASRVHRVSLRSVGEGYDILSFENDGRTRRYLEVKAKAGTSPVVDMSRGEWAAATRLRGRYFLVLVTQVREAPQLLYFRDPVRLEQEGRVSRTPTGWKVDLRRAPRFRG